MATLTKKKPTFAARKREVDFTLTIVKAKEGGYFVQCDQIPNAFTEAETIDEAVKLMETLIPEMLVANKELTKKRFKGCKTVTRKVSINEAK